ncbi:MAG: hypothetical protein V3S41_05235, partial [Spirochaetia bacterium]
MPETRLTHVGPWSNLGMVGLSRQFRCVRAVGSQMIIVAVVFAASAVGVLAYEDNPLSVKLPSTLEALTFEVVLQHRFFGSVLDDPLGTALGTTAGANVRFAVRGSIDGNLEINAAHVSGSSELALGVGYGHTFPALFIRAQLDAQIYTAEWPATGRIVGVLAQLSAKSLPLFDRITIGASLGYEAFTGAFLVGFGTHLTLTDYLSVVGSYAPLVRLALGGTGDILGGEGSYAVGIMLKTAGHQFALLVSNSAELGPRSF